MSVLGNNRIGELHDLIVRAEVSTEVLRSGLASSIVASLQNSTSRMQQVLLDLHQLNKLELPDEGHHPLASYVGNAARTTATSVQKDLCEALGQMARLLGPSAVPTVQRAGHAREGGPAGGGRGSGVPPSVAPSRQRAFSGVVILTVAIVVLAGATGLAGTNVRGTGANDTGREAALKESATPPPVREPLKPMPPYPTAPPIVVVTPPLSVPTPASPQATSSRSPQPDTLSAIRTDGTDCGFRVASGVAAKIPWHLSAILRLLDGLDIELIETRKGPERALLALGPREELERARLRLAWKTNDPDCTDHAWLQDARSTGIRILSRTHLSAGAAPTVPLRPPESSPQPAAPAH